MPGQYAIASPAQVAAVIPHKTHHLVLWLMFGVLVAVAAVILGAVASAVRATPSASCTGACPPPLSSPLLPPHRYVSSTYGYSVDYYDSNSVTLTQTVDNASSVGWLVQQNPDYAWQFSGTAAGGQSADGIVKSVHDGSFPTATFLFPIQGAAIGYTPASGSVYDLYSSNGQSVHLRLFIMAAIKRGVAVIFVAQGEYKPNVNYGHPNPSLTPAPILFDASLNSVRWKGDPPL